MLDVIAPIQDWRTGQRSPEHLDALMSVARGSVIPGGEAYETVRKIVCASAEEAGYKDIPAQLPDGTPVTMKACEVHINLISPNPDTPDMWYQLDSIPTTGFPAADDAAGWASYKAALRPVISSADKSGCVDCTNSRKASSVDSVEILPSLQAVCTLRLPAGQRGKFELLTVKHAFTSATIA